MSHPTSSKTRELLESLSLNVPRGTLEKYLRYIDLIQEWNQKINLTGAKTPQQIIRD
ncbi:MAG TPA: hypothetical protein DF383_07340, partial [Deltaproteobacteria bacterium]|nr:hypothetical protein [Deltaproteobacteria bacterium]